MRRKARDASQTSLNGFMQKVEAATAVLEETAAVEPRIIEEFTATPNPVLAREVGSRIGKVWDAIYYKNAKIYEFAEVILSALERREDDYMKAIKGMDRELLMGYSQMFAETWGFFIDGNYGDPLGNFYMEHISHGKGGEFFTPFQIAYMMAQMLDPEPEGAIIDPTCGTGVMLIAARCVIHQKHGWIASSRYGRNIYGIDINADIVGLAKINMYLTDYVYMTSLITDHALNFVDHAQ